MSFSQLAHWHHLHVVSDLATKVMVGVLATWFVTCFYSWKKNPPLIDKKWSLNGELSAVWYIVVAVLIGKMPCCWVGSGGTCAEPWGARQDALGTSTLGRHKMPECGASSITLKFIWSVIFRGVSQPSPCHVILKPHCCHYIYMCMIPVMISIPDLWKERWDSEKHRACFICPSCMWNRA